MRISDWISDVCSSDLRSLRHQWHGEGTRLAEGAWRDARCLRRRRADQSGQARREEEDRPPRQPGRDRTSGVEGKSAAARVGLGGSSNNKNRKTLIMIRTYICEDTCQKIDRIR